MKNIYIQLSGNREQGTGSREQGTGNRKQSTVNCKLSTLIILCLLLLSCIDNTSGQRFNQDYIVIAGMLVAGETITPENPIFVGRSISVSDGKLWDLFIDNATVTITDCCSGSYQELSFNWGSIIREFGYFDPTESFIIESGKTYRIDVIVDGKTTWAETTVPVEFEILENSGYTFDSEDEYPTMIHSTIDREYSIELRVDGLDNVFINQENYCLEEWYNAYWVLSDYLGDLPEDARSYENDMNGSPRRLTSLTEFSPNSENLIKLPFNQLYFLFYGDYRVSISLVDDNYYLYQMKSMGYFHGGVKNGIGCFGSSTKKMMYTRIVE